MGTARIAAEHRDPSQTGSKRSMLLQTPSRMTRFVTAMGVAIPMLVIAGCYYTVTTEPLPAADRSAAAEPGPAPYRIHVADKLAVKFYQNPDLNEEVLVRPDGKI